MPSRLNHLIIVAVAICLTVLFWGPLWVGYGFIGGDLYPYFFPQKAFFADSLHSGQFPLWNNLTGLGYPVLGESQTGAVYPFHWLAYGLFDLNTAYNIEHVLHYVICFVSTALFGRAIGLRSVGSLLMATVFTYGWFPVRACLEWSILTGAWMPVALCCVEMFYQTRQWKYSIGLSLVLGLQLLAGHFHLAFITQLLTVSYGLFRFCRSRQGTFRSPILFTTILLSVVMGFFIAAVQLLPAWELKTRSSRATVGGEHDPDYGHMPPLYVSQLFVPWLWYSPLTISGDESLRTL
ncbi:MAG: hypothetical protein FJ267_12235, partial [Planctomycetes bacterium]|nr:hypothetical protein [Planctomycetota bacterium]